MSTVHFKNDRIISTNANHANTRYVVDAGVDLDGGSAVSLDATVGVDNRSFQINGRLGGSRGLDVGNNLFSANHSKVTISDIGLIDSHDAGIGMIGSHNSIVNHGVIESRFAIGMVGNHNSLVNAGIIVFTEIGVVMSAGRLDNSGEIGSTQTGISSQTLDGQHLSITNSGFVRAPTAVAGGAGVEQIVNRGVLDGEVTLGDGNDRYDGRNGQAVATISGGGGEDRLIGGNTVDIMSGGTGRDVLTGGRGADEFIFGPGSNVDRITDFKAVGANHDQINLANFNEFIDFDDLKPLIHQHAGDAVIGFADGDKLVLHHVDAADLSALDFIF